METECSRCGHRVVLNDHAARYINRGKPILCTNCMRQGGRRWDASKYREYLQSEAWGVFRARALRYHGNKCGICGATDLQLDVHHNNYERLGCETMSDVIVLCHQHHEMYHKEVGQ